MLPLRSGRGEPVAGRRLPGLTAPLPVLARALVRGVIKVLVPGVLLLGPLLLAPLFLLVPLPRALALEPLVEGPGDAERGRAVVLDRDRGHCLLCHRIAQLDEGFQGTIGPPLGDVGNRLSASELRARVVDPTRLNPATVMPAYHRVENLRQVAEAYRGLPVLTAREVEDVVAFLVTIPQASGSDPAAPTARTAPAND